MVLMIFHIFWLGGWQPDEIDKFFMIDNHIYIYIKLRSWMGFGFIKIQTRGGESGRNPQEEGTVMYHYFSRI